MRARTMVQFDVLKEVHGVHRKIHRLKPKKRRELMRNVEDIARLLKKGDMEQVIEKINKFTTKE
jgi:hypothetical protein